jgi:UDP-N-acetylglucosamine--dolichyl-phosphate N-acetylglucosaminephosphotransferase
MLDNTSFLIYGVIVSAISFSVIYLLTPFAIKYLTSRQRVVPDAHKPNKPSVPRPAGPVMILGIAAAEIALYVFTMNNSVLAILLATVVAFLVGYIDDRRVLPGWFKPVALLGAALPLVLLGAHATNLNLIFGSAFIPLLYVPLIFIIIPITGNTVNSIDVLNGVASRFVIVAAIPLMASIAVFGTLEVFLAALPLFFGSLALYRYHRFPSRIFPGDSGTLLLGAMYGALAIAGSSEIIGVIALLPAVMNSFLFLASVKRIVEHRQVKTRPVVLLEDYRLAASTEKLAPATLVRLILADGPLSEKEIGNKIFRLAVFTALLASASIAVQYFLLRL